MESPEIRYLQSLFARRAINRREFMGRAVALGATTALATSLLGEAANAAKIVAISPIRRPPMPALRMCQMRLGGNFRSPRRLACCRP